MRQALSFAVRLNWLLVSQPLNSFDDMMRFLSILYIKPDVLRVPIFTDLVTRLI